MKIAYIVTRADEIGGVQVHVRDLAAALQAAGHAVQVLAAPGAALPAQLAARGVAFVPVPDLVRPIAPWRDLKAVLQLRRRLAAFAPDLVSTHSSKAGWLGRLAARSLGIPVLFTAHGWAFTEGVPALPRRFYAFAERLAAPLADHVVTVSDYDRRLALARRVVPAARLSCIPNGMPDLPPPERPLRREGPVRLVMVARFAPPKGQALLLHALAPLRALDWELELVGDGPLLPATRNLATELGLAGRVRFPGARDDVAAILAAADLFVLASAWEGMPRSILEAMRAALPVVASDVGGVAEEVVDGETGLLVPPGEVDALTARLDTLLRDPALRLRLGAAARRRFEREFRFEIMLERTLALYRRVLAQREAQAGTGRRGAGLRA